MPYNQYGQGITHDQQLEEEYWLATHKLHAKIGTISLITLLILVGASGVLGIGWFFVSLITAPDMFLNLCGICSAVLMFLMTIAALIWTRF